MNLSEAELNDPMKVILTYKKIRMAPLLRQVFQLKPHRKETEIEAIEGDTKNQSHLSKATLTMISSRIEINFSVDTQSFMEKYCQK